MSAAMALGLSRLEDALDPLIEWWEEPGSRSMEVTAFLAIAMLRQDRAINFLLKQISEGSESTAKHAIDALSMYRHDADLRQRVESAAAERGLGNIVREVFSESQSSA